MYCRLLLTTIIFYLGLVPVTTAQFHNETGDAGDVPETAQNTGIVSCGGSLLLINGSLSLSDVDMYAICIPTPALFSASTVGNATFDTQLWLFNADGRGITFNDDANNAISQSTITGQFVSAPGTYYLAISRFNRDALNCDDLLIWRNTPFVGERAPDGPGATGRVKSWSGTTTGGVSYGIVLTGTQTAVRTPLMPCDTFEGWDETQDGGGDAGELPETAQPTGPAECDELLPRIRGELSTSDTDIYIIYIHNPVIFRATTESGSTGDTQLWLFDSSGNGVTFNDNTSAGVTSSTITNRFITQPGIYYLAITLYDRDALGCAGQELWADEPRNTERTPDGSGSGRVGGWAGSTGSTSYVIELTGVCTTSPPDPPTPCQFIGWDETANGGGDAGNLPSSAQLIHQSEAVPCQTPVTGVRGHLTMDDVDMYVICITDPSAFNASTVGSAGFDTQLWLFNCDGNGVTFNDDSVGVQSTITGQFITQPGIYLLAISRWDNDPLDTDGNQIWADIPPNVERQPDGPGLSNPVTRWSGGTEGAGQYIIRLQGAYFVDSFGCEGGCQGDVNEDGCVDDADLLIILFNFGQSGSGVQGDLNGDSTVDDADLLIALFDFGCGC